MRRDVLNDPELPYLRTVIDPGAMSELFEERLRAAHPEQGIRVEGTSVEKVYYRQHKHCGVLHRLRLRNAAGEERRHWFFVRHYPASAIAGRHAKALRKAGPPASPFAPVSCWSEQGMLVWPFPNDPRLAHLPEAANPDTVSKLVESNAPSLGLAAGTECVGVRCEQVKCMPGKRVVLRFEVDVVPPGFPPRTLRFYSKTYGGRQSFYVFEAMEHARAQLAGAGGGLEIPRSLLHIDSLHTFWQEEWEGEPMSSLYGTDRMAAAIPVVGAALARLHTTRMPGLGEAFYVDRVGEEALEDAHEIGVFLPEDAERVLALGRGIAAAAERYGPPAAFPSVPIHGAFRMSQLLGKGDRLAMTDFDATALGDPHYDVAEFMASVLYQRFRRGFPEAELAAHCDAFLAAYHRHVDWTLDRSRLDWFVSAFMLEKFHGTLKGLELPVLECIDDVYELAERHLVRAAA